MDKVMSVNAGSSSLKFKLYEMPEEKIICKGLADRIGHNDAIFKISWGKNEDKQVLPLKDHAKAVDLLIKSLIDKKIISSLNEIKAIGHRIVQGGKYFSETVKFDKKTEDRIESLIPLSPLHNKAHLVGFRAFKQALPNVCSTATFDTAFFQTLSEEDYLFPIPYTLSKKYDIRRYGAHGTSHRYLVEQGSKILKKKNCKIITCHLGNGASISASVNGKCVATSMGLTPLGGVMMGTRSGDLDPSVFNYLVSCTKKSAEEVYQMLNKESGLLGVSGVSNDSRDVSEAVAKGNPQAIIADKLFIRRILDYIGQYYIRIGGCDMLIFSAGIGENSPYYRKKICDALKPTLGTDIDAKVNSKARGETTIISTKKSKIKVAMIPTDEEVVIARDAYRIYKNK